MNSYWMEYNINLEKSRQIDNNYIADVCIIGCGLTGLSTAYYLAKCGLKVILIDKFGIGEKASGHTTAKITFQHGLIYNYLINSFGIEFAYKYFKSNSNAIYNIKKIIADENIKCDFEFRNNFIYTQHQDNLYKINNELKALNTLFNYDKNFSQENNNISINQKKNQDIKSFNEKNTNCYPQFVNSCELPFNIAGAIKLEKQAQFHPRKYMEGLANCIIKNRGLIFTNSVVTDICKIEDKYVTYANNFKIQSKYVVIASHYPFINFPGFYFTKMYQATSYAIGIETDKKIPNDMYINDEEPILSFRNAENQNKKLLIIGGGNHKTGYSPDSEPFFGYKYLDKQRLKYFPNSKILFKWSTRDCITLDKIPYIGAFSSFMPNVYVATGFNKWGMTTSNVAANIIADSILNKKNEFLSIYNSTRLNPMKNKEEVKNMASQTIKSFITNKIKIPKEDISKIQKDNGGIIKIKGVKVGIFKDKFGKIYAINPTCTHLGCLLTWNNVDKTWDCPCHGSRFDYTGKNIYDPAFKDLEKINLE